MKITFISRFLCCTSLCPNWQEFTSLHQRLPIFGVLWHHCVLQTQCVTLNPEVTEFRSSYDVIASHFSETMGSLRPCTMLGMASRTSEQGRRALPSTWKPQAGALGTEQNFLLAISSIPHGLVLPAAPQGVSQNTPGDCDAQFGNACLTSTVPKPFVLGPSVSHYPIFAGS